IAARVTGASRALTMTTSVPEPAASSDTRWTGAAIALGSIALPLLLWWGFIKALSVPDMLGKTPWGVIQYLFLSPVSAQAQERLLEALAQTLPITVIGMFAGLMAAFAL